MYWVHEKPEEALSVESMAEVEKYATLACTCNRKDTFNVKDEVQPEASF